MFHTFKFLLAEDGELLGKRAKPQHPRQSQQLQKRTVERQSLCKSCRTSAENSPVTYPDVLRANETAAATTGWAHQCSFAEQERSHLFYVATQKTWKAFPYSQAATK